ncbi:hypothetical protein [Nocardiopsis tropica]|uniref:Uncharacterized protein n=1 Tax=Nocardiopsis tropica TaxID=109330 RepID=A0ABU7L0H2_9ACTN|nr:hypothetical protein [Nocardiopsis umidischolae]MEE2055051.1 hypothetical protein [Nocardiopsis umidischolae]
MLWCGVACVAGSVEDEPVHFSLPGDTGPFARLTGRTAARRRRRVDAAAPGGGGTDACGAVDPNLCAGILPTGAERRDIGYGAGSRTWAAVAPTT